jgi:hypothetical protein
MPCDNIAGPGHSAKATAGLNPGNNISLCLAQGPFVFAPGLVPLLSGRSDATRIRYASYLGRRPRGSATLGGSASRRGSDLQPHGSLLLKLALMGIAVGHVRRRVVGPTTDYVRRIGWTVAQPILFRHERSMRRNARSILFNWMDIWRFIPGPGGDGSHGPTGTPAGGGDPVSLFRCERYDQSSLERTQFMRLAPRHALRGRLDGCSP